MGVESRADDGFENVDRERGMTAEALTERGRGPIDRPKSALGRCDVLHILWPGDYGGVQTHVVGFVRAALVRGEMTHRVCFLEGVGSTADALADVSFRLGFRRGWGPVGLWRFARALRRLRPRLIHFHWRVLGPIAVARVICPRTPMVWTEHHPGAVTGIPKARFFYRAFKRFFRQFVVTSPAMIPYVEKYGVSRDRIRVIPYGLNVPLRAPDGAAESRGNVVGVITRLDGPKRVDLFLDVIKELRARGVVCSGIVVGDGDHKEIYEQHGARLGIASDVEFVGMRTDVAQWLDRFDVFLTTSSVDTFGLAVLEAMARGVPVVGMPCPGGLPDLLTAGGVLTPNRDPSTAADAVEALLASPEQRAELAKRGYDLATGYTLDAAVVAHTRMYREILATRADLDTAAEVL